MGHAAAHALISALALRRQDALPTPPAPHFFSKIVQKRYQAIDIGNDRQ
jgi:hypothetical protein